MALGDVTVLGMSPAELAVIVAVLAWAIDRVLDLTGKSPSTKRLRAENEDLVRRNGELEETTARYEEKLTKATARITALEAKVEELEKRDQAAVLAALDRHEAMAEKRYKSVKEGDDRRHAEALAVLREISDTQRVIAERLAAEP
jgi:hypothetical protein